MAGISITSQRAQLEISTQRAQLNITRPRPKMMVRTRRAAMTISRQAPRFKVNWEQVRAESGLTPMVRQGIEAGNTGYQMGWEGVGFMSQDGDMMADIAHNRNDGVGNIARNRVSRNWNKEFNLGSMPQNLAQIEWDMGYNDITWEPHELIIEWEMDTRPQINFNPHSIDIRIKQHADVKITYDPEYFEMQQGRKRKVDRKI